MTLEDPYWVFGTITEDGVPSGNATITIVDGIHAVTQVTGSNGRYILDISSIANHGDTLTINVLTSDGTSATNTFVLNISDPNLFRSFALTPASYCVFTIVSSTSTILLRLPTTLMYVDGRTLNRLNLWSNLYVGDAGKSTENINMIGFDKNQTSINSLDSAIDRGDELTISGFSNTDLDGVWVAESFTYTRDNPWFYGYSLTLEKK